MPRLNSLVTVLLVLTVAIGNGTFTFPTEAFFAKLRQLQARNVIKRQTGGSDSNGSGISIGDFPAQCQKGCTPAIDALNTCDLNDSSCLCTPAIDSSLQFCIECTVAAIPGISTDGETLFYEYNILCAGTGVTSLTISGVLPSTDASSSSTVAKASPATTSNSEFQASTATAPLFTAPGPKTTIYGDSGTSANDLSTTTANEVAGIGTSTGVGASKVTSLNAAMVAAAPGVEYITMGLVVAFCTALFV